MYECISTASLNTAYFCPTLRFIRFQMVFLLFFSSIFYPAFEIKLKPEKEKEARPKDKSESAGTKQNYKTMECKKKKEKADLSQDYE